MSIPSHYWLQTSLSNETILDLVAMKRTLETELAKNPTRSVMYALTKTLVMIDRVLDEIGEEDVQQVVADAEAFDKSFGMN